MFGRETSRGLVEWSRGESNPRPVAENIEKQADFEISAAPCAARDAQAHAIDPTIATLINAWDNLPEPVRAGILAMIQAAKGGE
ncbi:MAG: hypothetical protein IT444_11965 [Phycisphaeraceae bacterium]|nr:hypothetical protein [Phycisphaeraceae bacterium]